MFFTVRRDRHPKGVTSQYMHKKITEPMNLAAKCSKFNEPIIMAHKEKTETKSTNNKVHVSFQSTSSCNIQSVNILSKCFMFEQAK